VFEVRFQQAPEIRYSGGYLTIDLGYWHFHLCVGPQPGDFEAVAELPLPVLSAV
jgi:hypothetical protein